MGRTLPERHRANFVDCCQERCQIAIFACFIRLPNAVVVDQPAAPAPVVRGCSIAPASGRVLSTRVAGCVPAGERARSNGAARPADVRHARRNPRRDRMAIYEGGGEAPAGSHKKAAGDESDGTTPSRVEVNKGGELGSRARNEGSADCLVPALCRVRSDLRSTRNTYSRAKQRRSPSRCRLDQTTCSFKDRWSPRMAGPLACRELDDTLGLTATAGEMLASRQQ